jgi:Flp pilus assembly protein CpaB
MRTQMTTRTKVALLAGIVFLGAGGGGAAYLGSRHKAAAAPVVIKVPAYEAFAAVPAGTLASTAIAQGSIRAKSVLPADRPANAVTDPSQLSGRVAGSAIRAGALLTTDMFPDPQTHIGTVVIPAGMRALALELQPVPGIAGFAGAGDRIDVYGVAKGDGTNPSVRLVLQGVAVLNVNCTGLPAVQGQPGGPSLIYLVAVTPVDAERLIFLNEFDKLYFDLVPKGEGPVKTPGAGPATAMGV